MTKLLPENILYTLGSQSLFLCISYIKETDLVQLRWPVEANTGNELNGFKMQLSHT